MVDGNKTKRRWFRLLAVGLALLPFVVIEVSLRYFQRDAFSDSAVDVDPFVTFSKTDPLFVRDDQQGIWATSPERHNFFRPAEFTIEKPDSVRRVFVVGGSTVQGRPFAHETAFSTWLKLQLQSRDPQTRFEMVNVGGVSYASYRVAILVDEILAHEPDLIILYTGHNEFLENRSYAPLTRFSSPESIVSRIGSKLHSVRWLQRRFAGAPEKAILPGEVDAALDHEGGLDSYQRDPLWRQQIHQHFAITFDSVVRKIQQRDIELVICSPACDLIGTPPIKTAVAKWNDESSAVFDRQFSIARDETATLETRIAACRAAFAVDPEHAGVHFLLGRLLLDQGDAAEAKKHLVAARDHDVCPLRATTTIIGHVESIAKQYNVPIIATERLLDQRNHRGDRIPDGIPDAGYFVDHVHPTIAGHQVIAQAVADRLAVADLAIKRSEASDERYSKLADQHMQTLGEDYFIRGKQRLAGLRQWAAGRAGELGLSDL